ESGRQESIKTEGKVSGTLGNFPKYEYGDKLEFSGNLVSPKNFSTGEDDEAEFDYRSYLAKTGVYSLMNYPKVRVIAENRGNIFYRSVYSVKTKFEENLGKILSEPQASFLAGLLLGSRGNIPDDLKEKFKQTGTSHILAISGYNISVLAWFLASLLAVFYLSPRLVFWLSVSAIFVFVILTGAEPSVIRAALMGSLVLLARKEGRVYSVANAIVFAGAAMLFADPFILRYDIGFQLSFLATLGLILILPRLENYFGNLPAVLGLKEAFIATMSAQVAVLPLILYNFGNLSLISVLANILILPAVPFAMFFGFFAGAASFIALPLGKFIGFFAWVLLSYEIKIVEILAAVPFGFFKISHFPIYLVILYYAGLAYFLIKRKRGD
ncbi:MAG: ComEC/Rec2 family competence protein, partial [Patescibacteria group bacterium]